MARRPPSASTRGAPPAPKYQTPKRAPQAPRRSSDDVAPESPEHTPGPASDPWLRRLARALETPVAGAIALALSLVIRGTQLVSFNRSPFARGLILDHAVYDTWALRIARGAAPERPLYWVDPLYAWALASVYATVGHRLVIVRALQAALGVATVALTGSLARRITGRDAVAHGAMFAAALYGPLVHNEMQVEKAALTTLLATAALALFLRDSRRAITASGLLTGLAVLGRGNLLLAIPAGIAALFFEDRPDRRDRALRFGLAACAVVGALTVRNVVVGHELVVTTTIGGPSLYAAQARDSVAGHYVAPSFVRPASEFEHDDFHTEAERRAGHALTDGQVDAFWRAQALREIAASPANFIERTARKLRLSFHDVEVSDNDDLALTREFTLPLRAAPLSMGLVAPLALVGAFAWWSRSRAARVTVGAVAVYTLSLAIFYVMGRLRLPMAPGLLALAASGVAWIVARWSHRDLPALARAFAGVALASLLCLAEPAWLDDLRTASVAVACNNLASQALADGRTDDAITLYERAIATRPSMVVGAMRTLGDVYLRLGRLDDAERVMRRVLAERPDSPAGRARLDALAEAYRNAGRSADADRLARSASPSPTPSGNRAPQPRAWLTESSRATLAAALSTAPPGTTAYLTATQYDPLAVTRADELSGLFAQSGWRPAPVGRTTVRVRPGVYLFAADERPPAYVTALRDALQRANVLTTYASGYRAYFAERLRENPSFQGFPLAPTQPFVLVVGRQTE